MKKLFAKHELYAKKVVKIALNRGFNNYFENFVKFRFHILIVLFYMNLIWFLCWFSDSIIDGFARAVLAFAELVGCFNAVISADIAFDYTADSSVSFTIIFF